MSPDARDLQEPTPALFARYLSGEADSAEALRVSRWIAGDPARRELMQTMAAAWNRPAPPTFDADDAVWQRIRAGIALASPPPPRHLPVERMPTGPVRLYARFWKAAAALVILVGGALLVARGGRVGQGKDAHVAASFDREVVTRRGERLALRLGDGTRVVLAPDSRLRLATGFDRGGIGERTVLLERGQAFFEVTHDAERPFRVHTPAAIVEDLGTEFVVTSYPETEGTRVVVASGIVSMHRPSVGMIEPALATLHAGDLGVMRDGQMAAIERDIAVGTHTSWVNGVLAFDNTPLAEAIPAIARWYDADIRLADPELSRQGLTATFVDETLAEALRSVTASLELRAEPRDGAIVLHSMTGLQSAPR